MIEADKINHIIYDLLSYKDLKIWVVCKYPKIFIDSLTFFIEDKEDSSFSRKDRNSIEHKNGSFLQVKSLDRPTSLLGEDVNFVFVSDNAEEKTIERYLKHRVINLKGKVKGFEERLEVMLWPANKTKKNRSIKIMSMILIILEIYYPITPGKRNTGINHGRKKEISRV